MSGKFDVINIAAVADERYAPFLGVMLYSLMVNNPTETFKAMVIDGGISINNQTKLRSLEEQFSIQFFFLRPDLTRYKNFKISLHVSHAAYYRISIPDIIDPEIDKILYLDSDLLILSNIRKLWESNISNYIIAAVKDGQLNQQRTDLGIPSSSAYFNSGLMLINVKRWRENNIGQKILDFIEHNSSVIKYWDQDGLNAILHDQWLPLGDKWNRPSGSLAKHGLQICYSKESVNQFIRDTAIIHFWSEHKPWHYACQDPLKFLYREYILKSPWKDYQFQDKTFKSRVINFIFAYFPSPLVQLLMWSYRKLKRNVI